MADDDDDTSSVRSPVATAEEVEEAVAIEYDGEERGEEEAGEKGARY